MLQVANRHGSGWNTVESKPVLQRLTTCCYFDISKMIDVPCVRYYASIDMSYTEY